MMRAAPHVTHEVLNQVPPLAGYDVADDPALIQALRREAPRQARVCLGMASRRAEREFCSFHRPGIAELWMLPTASTLRAEVLLRV